jgi:dsDNA-specific endonuclease/ATPase MutS2
MATAIETQIQDFREAVRRAERTLDRLEGEKSSLLEQLNDLGIQTEEELEEEIKAAEIEVAALTTSLDVGIQSFREKYPWLEEV